MNKGIAASPGIAIGRALVYAPQAVEPTKVSLDKDGLDDEIQRFREAVAQSRSQLEAIKDKTTAEIGAKEAEIFGAHLMFLDDPSLIGETERKIKEDGVNAEWVLKEIVEKYTATFDAMDDEYLKARAADVRDVGTRIIRNLMGVGMESLADLEEDVIIVARDLTPSDTAQMNKNYVLGFATDVGGRTSHTAIMARSLEIPAVVSLGDITSIVEDGQTIILDGNDGIVIADPTEEQVDEYRTKVKEYREFRAKLDELKDLPGETRDGSWRVELSANIGSPADLDGAFKYGAEGIGLFRTEFLYMDRTNLPTEDEQFAAYREVAEKMGKRRVIIRTLDIGGDKELPYLDTPEELNPFLGWRGLRICLDRTDIFKTQLRAIMRASAFGRLGIMFPMVGSLEEIRAAKAVLNEVKQELDREGISYGKDVEVGIMVELPAIAMIADYAAKEVDFFSIGTNDLIQYTLAVDRTNERISNLYKPFHPAVMRLIKRVIDAGHENGIWIGMCGEVAGDSVAAPILLGMGLDEFSMSAVSIPQVKNVIRSLDYDHAKEIAEKALTYSTAAEMREYLEQAISSLVSG